MKITYSFLRSKEGQIILLGLILLGFYFILVLFFALFFPNYLQEIFNITATNVIFGRMAGLSMGVASQMDTSFLVVFNFFIESIMVLILYPLFVLSWNKLNIVTYRPLNEFMEQSKANADKYEPLIRRYGVIGLILSVSTPFAMTGPVVGSFVGYLIGLIHHVTLCVFLLSTHAAIIIWVYLIKNFEGVLVFYSDMLMAGFLIATAVLVLCGTI